MIEVLSRLALATAAVTVLAAAGVAEAQQFEQPYSFTPRDTRVAIALVIHQVEDPQDAADNSTFIDQSSISCSVPSGSAEAIGNSVCNIIRGDQNAGGSQDQNNTGNQGSQVGNSTTNNMSAADAIEAALNGRN